MKNKEKLINVKNDIIIVSQCTGALDIVLDKEALKASLQVMLSDNFTRQENTIVSYL